MADRLRIISAASVTLEELAAAFTAAFSGYFYPMTLTAEQLSRRVRFEHLDILRSLLAYDDDVGELVGMAMLGVRQETGWVGGFGMTETYRGRGWARELMTALIAEARGLALGQLKLEVLTQNVAAIRLYERAGMKIARDLLIFERQEDAPSPSQNVAPLKEAAPSELLQHFRRLHLKPAAWQRDLSALLVMDGLRGLYLGARARPDAYALLRSWPGGLTYIVDLAAAGKEEADALCAALAHVAGRLRIINEPEGSHFCAALASHNFVQTERQHEMVMNL